VLALLRVITGAAPTSSFETKPVGRLFDWHYSGIFLVTGYKNPDFTGAWELMEEASGLHDFLEIVTKPDNIPIVAMLILVIFFTWLGLREAFKNDKLIEEGKEDEIPNEMWK